MRKILGLFLLSFFLMSANIGDYQLVNTVTFPTHTVFSTDKFGNLFAILGNQLLQFDKNGKPLANFSKGNLGELRSVDASNPLKIVLFYPDFAQIVTLNSKLGEQSVINLRNIGLNQPLVACSSENGGFWIYDRDDDQLKKIDLNLQIAFQSGNLTQAFGQTIQPNFICESGGYVYLNNPETGIKVFDQFGTFYKEIPYPGLRSFQIVDQNILFVKDNKFFRYESKSVSEKEILLPPHGAVSGGRIEQQQLYLLTSDSLNFYSF